MHNNTTKTDNANTDDWSINVEQVSSFDVPRFIRLFVIRRILIDYIGDAKINSAAQTSDVLSQLVSFIENKAIQETGHKILSRLLNGGIKTYMQKHYNEKSDANVIEKIFTDIILNKFSQKFQEITTYSSKYKYERSVFNSDDLMMFIFRYLTFSNGFVGDLHGCSLVNSYWLYHIWNSKLIYGKYNISQFINTTLKSLATRQDEIDCGRHDYSCSALRSWERLARLKNVELQNLHSVVRGVHISPSQRNVLCSRLSMMRNIEVLTGSCQKNYDWILKTILKNCKQNIRIFDMYIYNRVWNPDNRYPMLSPLGLLNAKDITMRNLCFYIKWSKKCKALKLQNNLGRDSDEWIKYISNNCDCSGIEYLQARNLQIKLTPQLQLESQLNSNSNSQVESTAYKLAQKFCNLKQLEIEFDGCCQFDATCLMLNLVNIVLNNDGYVHLKIGRPLLQEEDLNTLITRIKQHMNNNTTSINTTDSNFQDKGISKLTLMNRTLTVGKSIEKLLQLCRLQWLTLTSSVRDNLNNDKMLEFIRSNLVQSDQGRVNQIKIDIDHGICIDDAVIINITENISRDALLDCNRDQVNVFSSLKVVQTEESYCKLDSLLLFLQMQLNVFGKFGIFGIGRYTFKAVRYFFSADKLLIKIFDNVFKMMYMLLVNQIAIDIKIDFIGCTMTNYQVFKNGYQDIHTSYFNEKKLLTEYQPPKCKDNAYCVSLKYPQVSYYFDKEIELLQFCFVNVKAVDPWAQNQL